MEQIVKGMVEKYNDNNHSTWVNMQSESLSWLWAIIALAIIWEALWITVWIVGYKKKVKKLTLLGSFLSTGPIGMYFALRCSKHWCPYKATHQYVYTYGCTQEIKKENK